MRTLTSCVPLHTRCHGSLFHGVFLARVDWQPVICESFGPPANMSWNASWDADFGWINLCSASSSVQCLKCVYGPYSDLGRCFGLKYFSVLDWSCPVQRRELFESITMTYLTQVCSYSMRYKNKRGRENAARSACTEVQMRHCGAEVCKTTQKVSLYSFQNAKVFSCNAERLSFLSSAGWAAEWGVLLFLSV